MYLTVNDYEDEYMDAPYEESFANIRKTFREVGELKKPKELKMDGYVYKNNTLYFLFSEKDSFFRNGKIRISKRKRMLKLLGLLDKPMRCKYIDDEWLYEIRCISPKEKDFVLDFVRNGWKIKV